MKKNKQKTPQVFCHVSDSLATGGRIACDAPLGKNLAAPCVSWGKIQKMLNVLSKHLEYMVIDP